MRSRPPVDISPVLPGVEHRLGAAVRDSAAGRMARGVRMGQGHEHHAREGLAPPRRARDGGRDGPARAAHRIAGVATAASKTTRALVVSDQARRYLAFLYGALS